jgi:aspartate/glutamate racemase
MKTIGIVGGIAWPSSIVYYRIINELVAQRLVMRPAQRQSRAGADRLRTDRRTQRECRWNLVGGLLAEQGNILKAAGADFFLLACNTVLYAELAKGMFLPATREKFKAAIADLVQRGAQAVILGGTEFGMLLDAG